MDVQAWIAVFLNVVLVTVTTVYVWLTRNLLLEAQETRKASQASQVVVEVEPESFLLNLVIRNIGQNPATGITVEFDPPLISRDGTDLSTVSKIAGLGFGQQRKHLIDAGFDYFGKGKPLVYRVTTRWDDAAHGPNVRETIIDVGSYRQTLIDHESNEKVVKELKGIGKELHEIRGRFPDLTSWTKPDGTVLRPGLLGELEAIATAAQGIEGRIGRGSRSRTPRRRRISRIEAAQPPQPEVSPEGADLPNQDAGGSGVDTKG